MLTYHRGLLSKPGQPRLYEIQRYYIVKEPGYISQKSDHFNYTVKTRAEGGSVIVTVDLDRPLPDEFIDKVGFNMELFPGALFGKTWMIDDQSGIFPRQVNGPGMY